MEIVASLNKKHIQSRLIFIIYFAIHRAFILLFRTDKCSFLLLQGGKHIKERKVAGYTIVQSLHIGKAEFVIGHHPSAPNPYATWECSNGDNYFWGHYFNTRIEADRDLLTRASNQLEWLERIETPPVPHKKPQQQTAPNLPEKCFSVLSTTGQLIIIERGKQGYTLAGARCDTAPPREAANTLNAAMGVSKAQEAAMLAGSMFGWNRQAADPRNYTKNGKPIVPKQETSKEVR